MFLSFNEESQKLLLLALKEKNKLNDIYIGTEHIFLSLLSMKNNNICKILNECCVNYEKFSSFFVRKEENNYSNYFVFTPFMNELFKNLGNSSNKKNNEIGIIDIVIEILNDSNSKVVYVLRKLDVDFKKLFKLLNASVSKKKSIKKNILNDIGVNLNESNNDDVLVGRDEEISEIIEILCCRNKNNPILIGDAGVGKTAIVEELARRVEKGKVPLKLKNKKIYSISMSSLVAGTKYRGEFEEKINKLISEVEASEDIILFIDEIHTLVGAGGADGAIDASNILKPSLARGNIKIIGATTKDEYNKYFLDDKALNRRFRIVVCEEPDIKKTREILIGIKSIYEKYHNVEISLDIIDKIISFADKYIKNKKFPDKAIDILDEVCVLATIEGDKNVILSNDLETEKSELINLKNQALIVGDYKLAMEYSHREKDILSKISNCQRKIYKANKCIVNDKVLFKVMEKKTNIPFYSFDKIKDKIKKYKRKSFFNDEVLNNICNFTLDSYSSLVNGGTLNEIYISYVDEYLGNYFINDYLKSFFSKNNIIYLDVANFRNIDDLLGYTEKNNLLDKIKLYPFSVFVVTNYKDCDLGIREFFEKINKYGYYVDKNNEKICFSNSLFIYASINKKNIGFNEINLNNEIYINEICLNKFKKNISSLYLKNNLNNEMILNIYNSILNNYNNLNNLDYIVKKEILSSNKSINKKRTMKV